MSAAALGAAAKPSTAKGVDRRITRAVRDNMKNSPLEGLTRPDNCFKLKVIGDNGKGLSAGDLEIVRNKRQITVGKAFPS
jgi:hypothetical protein